MRRGGMNDRRGVHDICILVILLLSYIFYEQHFLYDAVNIYNTFLMLSNCCSHT